MESVAGGAAIVLIVDDDPEILRSMQRVLGGSGYQLLIESDPLRAQHVIQTTRLDAVVSDIDMPGLNGLDLMLCVKQLQPRTARILVSGGRTVQVAIRALNDGAAHRYIAKPFDPDELRATLASTLANQRALGGLVEHVETAAEHLVRAARHRGADKGRIDATDPLYALEPERVRSLAEGTGLEHLLNITAD